MLNNCFSVTYVFGTMFGPIIVSNKNKNYLFYVNTRFSKQI